MEKKLAAVEYNGHYSITLHIYFVIFEYTNMEIVQYIRNYVLRHDILKNNTARTKLQTWPIGTVLVSYVEHGY